MYCDLAKKVTEQTDGRPTKGTLVYSVLEPDRGTQCSLAISVFREAKVWGVGFFFFKEVFLIWQIIGAVRNTGTGI